MYFLSNGWFRFTEIMFLVNIVFQPIVVYAQSSEYVMKSAAVISLDGVWSVVNSNGSIKANATVPGDIYTDLFRNGFINDPYYKNNDVVYKWIGRENWTYFRVFDVECEILQKERVVLVADGLDTVCEIYLNQNLIGTSQSMFIQYMFDVKTILQAKNNSLKIAFLSPVKYAEDQHNKQILKYVIPPICPLPVQKGECHVNYIRKMQSSFSWDWGPSFPTQGIWKHIKLLGFNHAIISDVTVVSMPIIHRNQGPSWKLQVKVFVNTASEKPIEGNTSIFLDDDLLLNVPTVIQPDNQRLAKLNLKVKIPTRIPIQRWWPNGMGQQFLYKLTVTFASNEEITIKTIKIGFRTLDLIQEPVQNSSGLSFYFRVNGIPFFAKGSNWIPANSFLNQVTLKYTERLLKSAKKANMNIIRVWGGGVYETDAFYNLADELGILIWQDFMFAVALYPANEEFLKLVSTEVRQQVRRLQHHPSILLWAGNNENEQGLSEKWWPMTPERLVQYKRDYIKLYIKTIMPIVKAEDPSRPFLPSSPSNGPETEREGWIAADPQDLLYGDVHFYTYTGPEWDWKTYPRARFVSEYGFQSYPSFESFQNVSQPDDWTYPFSNFIEHRQHHMFGNLQILSMIFNHLNITSKKCGVQGFKDMLYLSQIIQAVSIKTETEQYRRSQSDVINSEGKTMGALYWQLNDIWQAPSWSSIEYGGKWKMLHYYAKNFFSPILVSPYIDNETVIVSVISDKLYEIPNIALKLFIYKWPFFEATFEDLTEFNQLPSCAQRVYSHPLYGNNGLLNKGNCTSAEECFLYFTITTNTGNSLGPSNFLLLSELKNAVGLAKSHINVTEINGPFRTNDANFTFRISLKADRISPFVWLDITNVEGYFSDNGFIMITELQEVFFYSTDVIDRGTILGNINVRSLMDVCTGN